MRYVVGYSANARGRDAVNLAIALARRQNASLELVLVVPDDSPYNVVHPPAAGYQSILTDQAKLWLAEALTLIPVDVPAQTHVRKGESEASVLIAAAEEFGAGLLVIGAGSRGLFKRFTIGPVASALLHAATVPVALAPQGYGRTDPITRLTCGIGLREGAQDVLDVAAAAAGRRKLPLRLVSLVALDGGGAPEAAKAPREHADERLAAAVKDRVFHGVPVELAVAQGRSIEDAVDHLAWEDSEVLLIGSSRLARDNSLFLGSTANRILRSLPVPMIVVPRSYKSVAQRHGSIQSEEVNQ
ncbi:universal stress protein [Paenarthrobacter sp. PH39-S1]|uniref:universal stress protein n=1 Tax=Paenarthrobacter sp. PH39-S1 TaxID=3046204 RepID=UPI0024BBBA53|nr:universal stress protein [Paenarthrobacter sp. PH39-S1]MDJ0357611.1 universal stress protein [Paenarthrobacter sp. PH39-S1]